LLFYCNSFFSNAPQPYVYTSVASRVFFQSAIISVSACERLENVSHWRHTLRQSHHIQSTYRFIIRENFLRFYIDWL